MSRERVRSELLSNQSRAQQLTQQSPTLVANGDRLVSQAVERVTASSSLAVRDILSQLPSLVDNYDHPFDPIDLGPYRAGLFSHFDDKLSAELERIGSTALTGVYEAAKKELIGEWQRGAGGVHYPLPLSPPLPHSPTLPLSESHQVLLQLSSSELAQLGQRVPALQVSYALRCAELCEDFHEDLRFRFSLGLNTLLVFPLLHTTCDTHTHTHTLPVALAHTHTHTQVHSGSWLSVLRGQLSFLQSVLSLEYAVPSLLLVTALLVRLQ